jgi:ATP-dependent helicase/nuclease subunit B
VADRPLVYTIPPDAAFADSLALGLIEQAGGNLIDLAQTLLILPNRRAVRAMTDAFVRLAPGGLLLPRMAPVADLGEDAADGLLESLSTAASGSDYGAAGGEAPAVIAAAVPMPPLERKLALADQLRRAGVAGMRAVDALRMADSLGGVLDELHLHHVSPARLADAAGEEMARHWEATFAYLRVIAEVWPAMLEEGGAIDPAARRVEMLSRITDAWRTHPPATMVVAAGMTTIVPAAARLLAIVARLPRGMVVLPGLDLAMAADSWDTLRPANAGSVADRPPEGESHPQFAIKQLLDGIGVAREEVERWAWRAGAGSEPGRTERVALAMAPARFTDRWRAVPAEPLTGVSVVEAAGPAEEAQVIALALRRVLETPGRTAALVTPDRQLAERVSAHMARYGVEIDDSAGRPLAVTPPGVFVSAMADAAAQRFAPLPLLALLKHPLARAGPKRGAWLRSVRRLDLALRGLRPEPGLSGVAGRLAELDAKAKARGRPPGAGSLARWWSRVANMLQPLEQLFERPAVGLAEIIETICGVGAALAGDELWRGEAGRSLAALMDELQPAATRLSPLEPADVPAVLALLMSGVTVRLPYGSHGRLAIYGLLEARLQRADLMILGGLNEGVWPAAPTPDPWLAPRIRRRLGLPSLERRIGLAAHDFVQALGAPEVLITRAARDASAPTVPSRFLLRLDAITGGLRRDEELLRLARSLDDPGVFRPVSRPAPAPAPELRPRVIRVTDADLLRTDPFAFYARRMLKLQPLPAIDAEATPADRGNFVHKLLEDWIRRSPEGDRAVLESIMAERRSEWRLHPLTSALWLPRVERMLAWVADQVEERRASGWLRSQAEVRGVMTLPGGIELHGRADRVDIDARGRLAIIDYKTGASPTRDQVEGGYALQLGLLALMIEKAAMPDVPPGETTELCYWKLTGGRIEGAARNPLQFQGKQIMSVPEFVALCARQLAELCDRYLLGDAPFVAKLRPEYATTRDFDQLSRLEEWRGREI